MIDGQCRKLKLFVNYAPRTCVDFYVDIVPISAVHCPVIPVWDNNAISSHNTVYRSIITITCIDGFGFKGKNITIMNVECQANATWKPPLQPCSGEYKHHDGITLVDN